MLDIRPDRDALSRFGITAQAVQDTVSAAIGGREACVIFEGDRRFAVTIRLADDSRADFQSLGQLPVPLPGSGFVPLQSVADIGVTDGPNQIGRENGKRRIIVEANVRGRDVAGVVADARTAIDAQVRLHSGEYLDWGGSLEIWGPGVGGRLRSGPAGSLWFLFFSIYWEGKSLDLSSQFALRMPSFGLKKH